MRCQKEIVNLSLKNNLMILNKLKEFNNLQNYKAKKKKKITIKNKEKSKKQKIINKITKNKQNLK